ncbi:MAG TPA: ParB N-terminal domain-containing protein [Bacteroidia bacterium]|nr:ParB N-terminal domain-containing protein [Bacteroidia bacterium]
MLQKIKLSDIQPAPYNPRKISSEGFDNLKASIIRLGMIKVIVARKENTTIIAGHQRTKGMQVLGIEECYAYFVSNVSLQDEIRFNQFHNMTELPIKENQPVVQIIKEIPFGEFTYVDPADIDVKSPGACGQIVSVITKLMLRYGPFANCVLDHENNVLLSSMYAYCCKLLNMKLLCYKLQKKDVDFARNMFAQDYGVFSYEHTEKKIYPQCYAQKNRLRESQTGNEKAGNSRLYEYTVIPNLKKEEISLDFGAGYQDYAKSLNSKGYNVFPLEFFFRKEGTNGIWIEHVKADFLRIKKQVIASGLFDVVICDSVLNSVHSMEAQHHVLSCLNAFCKPGGKIFISGRLKECLERRANQKKTGYGKTFTKDDMIKFVDEHGFSGQFRNGQWFYQKFHSKQEAQDLAETYFGPGSKMKIGGGDQTFQIMATKQNTVSPDALKKSLQYEFTLPLPNGSRYAFWENHQDFFKRVIELNGWGQDNVYPKSILKKLKIVE